MGTRKRAAAAVVFMAACGLAGPASAQTVLDEWSRLAFPPAPALKSAKLDPATTALLLLDFTHQTCSQERRPRCAASVPKLKQLHDRARASGMLVVYSIATADSKPADILPEIAPREGDTVLPSLGPDKFIKSEFEKLLRDRKIETVIVTGTAAQTTVLHTASSAALRGFKVVVPVDAMSSNDAFSEAYTVWHLANAARITAATTLTRADDISY
jgi:nicotinamidase-related amidase